MNDHLIHADDVPWDEPPPNKPIGARRKPLGRVAGNTKLGCSLYELEPGKKAFPYHFHHANEEGAYILDGEGVLRHPGGERPVRAGDYIAFPAGPEGAHQMQASGDRPLRYLCFSTMLWPEINGFPDSGKVGLFSGAAPGSPREAYALVSFLRGDARMGYLEGET